MSSSDLLNTGSLEYPLSITTSSTFLNGVAMSRLVMFSLEVMTWLALMLPKFTMPCSISLSVVPLSFGVAVIFSAVSSSSTEIFLCWCLLSFLSISTVELISIADTGVSIFSMASSSTAFLLANFTPSIVALILGIISPKSSSMNVMITVWNMNSRIVWSPKFSSLFTV